VRLIVSNLGGTPMSIFLKRAYESPEPSDGFRILVDRLWPRGLAKNAAQIDLWFKDAAPSTGLRIWFGHEPAKWNDFRDRYMVELSDNPEAIEKLIEHALRGAVTLVYAAKDKDHSHALVLKDYLENAINSRRSGN
jgi:uncharacterized protein YeaO (DUF488 family)